MSLNIAKTAVLLAASSTAGNSSTSESVRVLTGLLVILKASIKSLAIKLHHPARGHKAPGDVSLPFLTSKSSDTFLNACVIVDVPPGGGSTDKAVDVQVSLGSLDVNLKKDGFSIFVEPKVRANLARCLYCVKRMKLHAAVLSDKSLVVEHHPDCLGVPSVLLRNIHYSSAQEKKEGNTQSAPDAHIDLHKKSVTDYLNCKRFYGIFSSIIPQGVITFGVQTGTIATNLLSANSIRTFTIIWMRDIMERALTDPSSSPSLYAHSTLNGYLKAAKRQRTRSSVTSQRMSQYLQADKAFSTNVVADIDPVRLDIRKTSDPFPLISISAPGLALTLPIDDDTICRMISLALGGLLPFYNIRAVPMPMSKFEDVPSDDETELAEEEEDIECDDNHGYGASAGIGGGRRRGSDEEAHLASSMLNPDQEGFGESVEGGREIRERCRSGSASLKDDSMDVGDTEPASSSARNSGRQIHIYSIVSFRGDNSRRGCHC